MLYALSQCIIAMQICLASVPILGLNYMRALAREPCGAYMEIRYTKDPPKAPQYKIDVEKNNGFTTVGGRNFAPLYGEYLTISFSFPCVCPPLSPPALILICPYPQVPGIDLRLDTLELPIAILNLGVARGG